VPDLPVGRQFQDTVPTTEYGFAWSAESSIKFKQMFTVYALSGKVRNSIYVGMTSNIGKRLTAHNRGYERTTKPYRSFHLIYAAEHSTRESVRTREKYLKSGTGKCFLKSLNQNSE
jgi:putative endonuclease